MKTKAEKRVYTEREVIQKILFENEKPLSAKLATYKSRYSKGKLKQKAINEIILSHGYKIAQEALYVKV